MTTRSFLALAAGFAALAGTGCESATVTGDSPRTLAAPPSFVTVEPEGYQPTTDPVQRKAEFMASVAYRIRLREAMTRAEGWRDADAGVQAVMADTRDVPAFLKEQFAANYMLQTHLLTDGVATDRDRQEAVGRYTEMLVRHRSPNADLVDRSLSALEGYWTAARIARTAEVAYTAAETYVEAVSGCTDCGMARGRQQLPQRRSAPASAALHESIDGADRLAARF